jgi:molybdenum cofactor guanylyltransferase
MRVRSRGTPQARHDSRRDDQPDHSGTRQRERLAKMLKPGGSPVPRGQQSTGQSKKPRTARHDSGRDRGVANGYRRGMQAAAAVRWPGLTAVILAGGGGTRVGGRDKPMLPVGGVPMLDRVLAALAGADLRIVVGPARPGLADDVRVVREDPPGAGPAAATAAALDAMPPSAPSVSSPGSPGIAGPAAVEAVVPAADKAVVPAADAGVVPAAVEAVLPGSGAAVVPAVVKAVPPGSGGAVVPAAGAAVVPAAVEAVGSAGAAVAGPAVVSSALVGVFAADLPYLTGEAVGVLVDAVTAGVDGAVFVDERGKRQQLCGVWRAQALRAGVARLGDPVGKSMRAVFDGLVVAEVRWEGDGPAPYFDCDTDEDLRRAAEQPAPTTGTEASGRTAAGSAPDHSAASGTAVSGNSTGHSVEKGMR